MRVLRVYHAGRDPAHRARERELLKHGVEVTLVVPSAWPGAAGESTLSAEPYPIVELDVSRAGDVNRHRYAAELRRVLGDARPDLLDLHEEPFSVAAHQWLSAAPSGLPVVTYTAQNVDKRWPPPFAGYERGTYRRVAALYPCSRQAAAVSRGKGFSGLVEVIPLGFDPALFFAGNQSLDEDVVTLMLVGRLVPEKGVREAVHALAHVAETRPARLVLLGAGPEEAPALELAATLGIAPLIEVRRWGDAAAVADAMRSSHVVLVPSSPTSTWTEQFGRVIVEAQASGALVAGYAAGAIEEVGGAAALTARTGDVRALAAAVAGVLGDEAEFAERRRLGLEVSRGRTWGVVAAAQAQLYERARFPAAARGLPRSPNQRRAAARAEFGSTATTTAGLRPFALPLLRRGGAVPTALGRLLDAAAELRARLPVSRG
ncbi:MAG TPA: glycosyltransferase [Gaiellaceae bacterium]|nr:glycosyltransferase [Gaiellaceae bacterium]